VNESPVTQQLTEGWWAIVEPIAAYLPRVLAAAAVLVAGWLLARLLRAATVRLVTGIDRLWHVVVLRSRLEQLQPRHPPARIVGELVFWLTILFVVTSAADILGMGVFVNWLSAIVAYLPVLAAGLLIVLAGFVLSSLARDLVSSAASSAGIVQGDLLGRVVQGLVLLTAVVVGVDQMGVDVDFLATIAAVAVGALLGGGALAFGLGARSLAANVIAAQQIRKQYRVGDRVRVRELEGGILEIGTANVVLDTGDGRVTVPAAIFNEEISVLTVAAPVDEGR
jgi:small-conductance mechanosensitive channel